MSKRVSNKKGTTHRRGIKPARSGRGWRQHMRKHWAARRRRAALDRRHEMITEVRRRFGESRRFGKQGGPAL